MKYSQQPIDAWKIMKISWIVLGVLWGMQWLGYLVHFLVHYFS
jgi:hypothetical protein